MNNTIPGLVAEIKTQSPYGFKSDKSFMELAKLAIEYGEIISVHVDALYGGHPSLIRFIRRLTDKPILAKGWHLYHTDVDESKYSGANHVLRIDCHPKNISPNIDNWLEYTNLEDYLRVYTGSVVLNHRNLLSGRPNSLLNLLDIRNKLKKQNPDITIIEASSISTYKDVIDNNLNPDYFIVGEHLSKFTNDFIANEDIYRRFLPK